MRRKQFQAVCFLLCGNCASSSVREKNTHNSAVAAYTSLPDRAVPTQTLTVQGTESPCPPTSVAGRFKIPQEPASAFRTATNLTFYRSQTVIRQILDQEPNLKAVSLEMPSTEDRPTLLCMYWDLRQNDNVIDFYTCRHFVPGSVDELAKIGAYPVGYAFDVYGDARGNMAKFEHFMDQDHDGDMCDTEFVHLEDPPLHP